MVLLFQIRVDIELTPNNQILYSIIPRTLHYFLEGLPVIYHLELQ